MNRVGALPAAIAAVLVLCGVRNTDARKPDPPLQVGTVAAELTKPDAGKPEIYVTVDFEVTPTVALPKNHQLEIKTTCLADGKKLTDKFGAAPFMWKPEDVSPGETKSVKIMTYYFKPIPPPSACTIVVLGGKRGSTRPVSTHCFVAGQGVKPGSCF